MSINRELVGHDKTIQWDAMLPLKKKKMNELLWNESQVIWKIGRIGRLSSTVH